MTSDGVKSHVEQAAKSTDSRRVGLVYVKASSKDQVDQAFDQDLKSGLTHHDYEVVTEPQATNKESILKGSIDIKAAGATILLVVASKPVESQPDKNKPKRNNEMHELTAKLHNYADRELGARMICVTEAFIRKVMPASARLDHSEYFPASLRSKIDYMLGLQSYAHTELRESLGENTMIVAAHVAHPGTKERYLPSIAAVVVSQDSTAVHFSGSARL